MNYRNSERQIRNEWERSKPDAVCIVCGTISGNLEVINLGIHGKLFDKWNVAFVSVTQVINTHTPAKRMMLNILVTFAQFEREVITERVRDKMAASRRKGKWVGGTVPYAHRVEKRRSALTRMKRRSSTVSSDVTWRCKSPQLIAMELNKESVFNHNGRKWDTQYIHRILTNHHYVGEVECQAQSIRGSMKASCPGTSRTAAARSCRATRRSPTARETPATQPCCRAPCAAVTARA